MSLKNGDLKNTVLERFTIDEFMPKSGEAQDYIVVAFSVIDDGPANDLNTFIQRGFIDVTDVEVSPVTDDSGHYLVFVEVKRSPEFFKILNELIRDIENLTGPQEWRASTYLSSGRTFDLSDPALTGLVILDPEQYVTRAEFEKDLDAEDEPDESDDFEALAESQGVTIHQQNQKCLISGGGRSVWARVADFGPADVVMEIQELTDRPLNLSGSPEMRALAHIFPESQVVSIDRGYVVTLGESVAYLQDVTINR